MKKFPKITVNFALRGVVGIRGRNIAAALAKSPLVALKVLTEVSTEEAATFLEQDSTIVPNFAFRLILSCGNLVGVATPSPPFCGLRRLKKSTHERRFTAMKKYNTPHRRRVIKTRLTEEEYAEFSERVSLCKMSFEELTPTLLREFVEKIVIHESEALDGKHRGKLRRQEIEIYYSFVGKVELPDLSGSQPDRERQNFLHFFYFFISHEQADTESHFIHRRNCCFYFLYSGCFKRNQRKIANTWRLLKS